MADHRIDPARATVVVETARSRQTARPATPFRDVLAGGTNVLMAGAAAATSVVGGPVLAAAVHEAGTRVTAGVASDTRASPATTSPATSPFGGGSGELGSVATMQRESQMMNMQLLALQEQIQQENRRFSTLSNVLRARHDTAKAAVANIRG